MKLIKFAIIRVDEYQVIASASEVTHGVENAHFPRQCALQEEGEENYLIREARSGMCCGDGHSRR